MLIIIAAISRIFDNVVTPDTIANISKAVFVFPSISLIGEPSTRLRMVA